MSSLWGRLLHQGVEEETPVEPLVAMGPELQGECHVEGEAKRSRQTEVGAVVSDKQGSRSAKTCRKWK